ncbi:MAG: beta-N-acetylhexosaminidase [Candidatus Moranbacteria bacterium]|nr:beta-N-acetylhexosaminidase [Candidatus Moranbacteria bacterium]
MNKKTGLAILGVLMVLGIATVYKIKGNKALKEQEMADQQLKQEIGQMLMIGFRGTEASDDSYVAKTIRDLGVGGVILFDIDVPGGRAFPRNITEPEQVRNLVGELKSFSATPLLVAVDAEGGMVNRLKEKYGFIPVPSAKELGDANDAEKTKEVAKGLSAELKDLGINVDFAPVVDVNVNPENPVIGSIGRSFSSDPEKVTQQAEAFLDGLHENGVLSSLKHFPGHGSSAADSHLGLTDVTSTWSDKEFIPYERIIKDGKADMIMTAHIMNMNIDPDYPATLSSRYIQEILRDKLGFQGVVVSDDMQMGAIMENYGFKDAVIRAVNAGCDILILSNNGKEYSEEMPQEARDIIFEAVKSGAIAREKIQKSYGRIMEMKSETQ